MCKGLSRGLSAVVLLALVRSASGDSPCVSPKLIVKPPARVAFPGQPRFVGFDVRGKGVISAGWCKVYHWSWPELAELTSWESNDDWITWRSFGFDGRTFADLTSDNVLRLWDASDGKLTNHKLADGGTPAVRPA